MNVTIKNIKIGSKCSVAWQASTTGGLFQPLGHWTQHEGDQAQRCPSVIQVFGFYLVRVCLEGYKTFEHTWPVTEDPVEVKVKYKIEKDYGKI